MADQLDFSAAIDRLIQQRSQAAPEVGGPAAPTGLAPSTSVLTGTAPSPAPTSFDAALDDAINRFVGAKPPSAPTVPIAPLSPAAPQLRGSLGARAARDAASVISTANSILNSGVRPDIAAEIRRLSRDEGVPIPQAAQTYVERIRSARGRQYGRLLIENPGLRRVASQGTAYVDFMDDAAALATTETAFNFFRSAGAAFPKVGADVLNLFVTAGDIAERQTDRLILDPLIEADIPVLSSLAGYLNAELPEGVVSTREFIFGRPADVLENVSEYIGPPPEEQNVVTDVGAAFGQLAATALAYVLGGGPLALLVGGAQTTEEQRRRVEEAGQLGTVQGDIGIIGAAGVSTLIERLNLGLIFERIPENIRNRIVRGLITATTEGATESLQALSSNLVAKAVYDPDTGIVDGVAYEGLIGSFPGLVVGLLTPGRVRPSDVTDRLPQEAVDVLSADTLQSAADQATAAQQALETTRAAIEETATFARDPEAVRELLEAAGDQEVSIPVQEIERLYQEGALTDDDIAYLQVEDELTQQGDLSGDVSTTASRVLTLQGDAFARLSEHVRTQPSAPTTAEAREALANREADIERLQGVLEQAQAAADEVGVLSERIAAEVRAAAPQYTAAQGRAMGRLLAERYAARAALFEPGTTAQSLYERDKVAFEAAGQAAPAQTLEQAAQQMQATPEFRQWFGDSRVVDDAGAPLILYHGTRADFSAFKPLSHFGTQRAANDRIVGVRYRPERPIEGENIYPVFLSIQNPLDVGVEDAGWAGPWDNDIDMFRQVSRVLRDRGEASLADQIDELLAAGPTSDQLSRGGTAVAHTMIADLLTAAGYDGVQYTNAYEDVGSTSYVAFRPEQIKSIFNERPTGAPGILEQPAVRNDLIARRMQRTGIQSIDGFWQRWRDIMVATAGPDTRVSMLGASTSMSTRVEAMLSRLREDARSSDLGTVVAQAFGLNDDGTLRARIPREMLLRAGIAPTPENLSTVVNALEGSADETQTFEQAALVGTGPSVAGQSGSETNQHGLMPHLLVDAAGAREGKALVLSSTKNDNAQRQLDGIDEVLARHPDPLASPEAWTAMMADALASEAVPAPPYALIRDVNGDGAAQLLGGMTEGQIADADHGFANAADFRDMYINGEVTPVGTAKLFMWSFLSRGVSPYTQEALFIDGFSGVDAFIDMAAQGQFNYATSRAPYTQYGDDPQKVSLQLYKIAAAAYEGLPAKEKARKRKPQRKDADFVVESGEGGALLLTYQQWARLSAPAGSGQPGAGASHNLNAFGKLFLSKMSEDAGLGDGRSRLSVLHDMMSDPTSTGKEVRRQFLRMGEGVGIDNKVVSFTLLVAGYNDVLVLDRVQMRQMWNDGRFDGLNLYDGYKEKGKTVNGSALSNLTYGARGLLIYEAMERSLMDRIATIYQTVGRPEAASIGRYHWETWVASSNQEASHGTIDAIISEIKGNPDPLVGVTAKEGEYGSYAYGARYGRSGAGGAPYFLYEVPRGGLYKFSVPDFVRFQQEIKKSKNGVVPSGFKVTEGNGNAPWYFRSEVSLDALNAVARANGGAPVEAEILGGNDVADGRDQDISDRRAADQPGPAWTEFEQPAAEPGGAGGYSSGGLAPLEGAPNVVGASGPDPELVAVAERYAADNGIDLRRQAEFVEVDPERAARIAQAYEEMPHAPQDPAVQAAYADLIQQTLAQYQALVDAGYSFTFFDSETDPYAGNPWNAMRDLRANKTMAVYGTYDGYGTEGLTQGAVDDNPMLQDTGLVWQDQNGVDRPVTANDLFRAVHDAFGHGIEGAGFRARGEENAWQAHVRLFTGPAVAAITSETRGQNSWLNYGPYGEQNRTAAVEDTVFADQKTGLMPEWTWTEGRAGDAPVQETADAAETSLLDRGISPDPAAVRGRGAAAGAAAAEGVERAGAGLADQPDRDPRQQPVTAEDLGRLDDEAFLREFLTRPGWGAVTASLSLPDTEFYRNQRDTNPALYELSVRRQEERNRAENERLRSMLDQEGIAYLTVQGMYKGEPDGTSYIIAADEATVMRLGRSFGQDSVLTRDGLIFTQRAQADVQATGDVIIGEQSLAEDFYSITPGGTQFSMGLARGTSGPGVPRIPAGYTQRADRPQLPVRPDGTVELFHWSGSELATVDPAFAGTGPLQGAERQRGARVSFFGINPRERMRSQGTGYVKESGLGPVRHVAFVEADALYPLFEDPERLADGKDIGAAEDAIRAAGYLGYYTTDDGSGRAPLGNVAVLFEAVPVQVVPPEAQPLEQPTEGPQTPERGAVGAPRGSYRLPTSDDPRNLIRLSTQADPSTFVHEVGHMFLFQMLRDLQDPRITAEGRAQIEAQIAATRAWFESNAEQGLSDLKALAKSIDRRAKANKDDAQLQTRAARLNAAVERANAGGGAAYMQRVAQSFMDPQGAGYDEAAEVVYHELWARGFEQYLGTGSAPSAELRGVFAKFSKYITSIYKSLRRLNVTVSPEVADVFDRLLATEDAINAERRGALYQVSPGVLEGATPAEANELRRLAAEAEDEARTQMAARVENSLRAEERAKRRARREEIANEISLQVAAEPTYAAINIAKRGVMPDGKELGTGKISRAEFLAVSDENSLARMPKGMVSGKVAPDNAIPLGDLATLAGFPDIDTMIEALTNPTPPSEADAVKSRTDAQMAQEFGADLDAGALQTKAVEVAQNDKFQQLQQLQLRILRRLATQPMQRLAQRQAEQQGAPAAAADTAAAKAARAEQAAARTPREGVQAALARIRADVQRTANASQRRAQAAAGRTTRGIQRNVDPAAVEAAAERFVANLKVKDATPARYRQAASRLTTKIERAIAARNYTEASSLMEQRALNLAVAKRAAVVQSKIEQQRTRWREVTARSDKRLAQRYSIDWINAIRVMLEPFGMARSTPRNYNANKALAALASVEPTLLAEIQLTLATYGGRAQAARQAIPNAPYKDLGVQEALDMLETADTMLANARDSYGILVEGRRVEFAAISDEVAVNVGQRRKVQKQARAEARGRGTSAFRKTRRQISEFTASLRRIELWARDIDNGNPRGPMTRYLVRPVMRAVDAYTEARRGPQEALANLLRGRTDIMARKLIKATELDGYVFQSKGELLMALLHTGNPSNKRKLLLGGAEDVASQRKYVWGSLDADGNLDTTRWDRFTARLFAEGTLTKADMDLVQGIWDIFEQTKKPAQAAHKQMYGYYFTEIEAEPLITPVGTYRGGYAPAVTDVMMNPDGNRFEAEEVMSQQSNAAMFPGAEKGFTQSRTEYNQPLDLDLTRIPAHFDRVMKFAYLGPAVRQAARLVTSPAFREAVRPASPDVIDVAVIPWLQRTVQQRVTTPPTSRGWSGVSRVAAAIDRRVGLHIMAANLVNASQQVTGFAVAAARIPVRHLAAAGTRWRVDSQSARAYILSRSTFMQERLTGGMNDASTTLENILSEPGLLNNAQNAAMRYGYFAQQLSQNLVDPTVWLAAERHGMEIVYPDAYAEVLERTGDEAAADAAARAEVAEYADSVVRDTQAPLRPSDISGIEASSPLARLFLKFYSYFNAMGNLLVTETNIAMNSEMGWAGRYGRSFYVYLMIVTVPAIVAESIAQLARGGFDDLDDEDERDQFMFELLIGSQLKTMAAMVPLAGAAASTVYGIAVTDEVYDDRLSLSASLGVTESTVGSVVRLIAIAADPDTDVSTRRAVKTTLDAMGLALGLPINWASKPISYAASVAEGDSDPEGLLDIVQGALTGRDGTE